MGGPPIEIRASPGRGEAWDRLLASCSAQCIVATPFPPSDLGLPPGYEFRQGRATVRFCPIDRESHWLAWGHPLRPLRWRADGRLARRLCALAERAGFVARPLR